MITSWACTEPRKRRRVMNRITEIPDLFIQSEPVLTAKQFVSVFGCTDKIIASRLCRATKF
jgi:hypothetical protein